MSSYVEYYMFTFKQQQKTSKCCLNFAQILQNLSSCFLEGNGVQDTVPTPYMPMELKRKYTQLIAEKEGKPNNLTTMNELFNLLCPKTVWKEINFYKFVCTHLSLNNPHTLSIHFIIYQTFFSLSSCVSSLHLCGRGGHNSGRPGDFNNEWMSHDRWTVNANS